MSATIKTKDEDKIQVPPISGIQPRITPEFLELIKKKLDEIIPSEEELTVMSKMDVIQLAKLIQTKLIEAAMNGRRTVTIHLYKEYVESETYKILIDVLKSKKIFGESRRLPTGVEYITCIWNADMGLPNPVSHISPAIGLYPPNPFVPRVSKSE